MSRVGKYPITLPSGVTVTVDGDEINANGKLGQLALRLSREIDIKIDDGKIVVNPKGDSKPARAMWGTTRALLQNMVKGVSEGFTKRLEINGVGYRAAIQGKELVLQLGYSHDVRYEIPAGIKITADQPTQIAVSGADAQRVGQVAAEIRQFRGPEPYKGKGIKYASEIIVRKEGKKK